MGVPASASQPVGASCTGAQAAHSIISGLAMLAAPPLSVTEPDVSSGELPVIELFIIVKFAPALLTPPPASVKALFPVTKTLSKVTFPLSR